MRRHRLIGLFALLVVSQLAWAGGSPQGTAFNYQGVLKSGGSPFNGTADFEFRMFEDSGGVTQVGAMIPISGVTLTDGLFATPLDFGALAFAGEERWLEVRVRTPAGGVGPYTTLTPRQKIQTQPYAAYALASGAVGSGGLSGTYANALSFSNAGNAFVGDGSGLTNLNASNLASGVLADGRLSGTYSGALTLSNPANVVAGDGFAITNLNAANLSGVIPNSALAGTYSGAVNFTNAGNSFAGGGAGLTALDASNIASGTLDDARLSSSLLDRIPAAGFQPVPTGAGPWVGAGAVNDMAIVGNYAYVAIQGSTSLAVLNLSNPAIPFPGNFVGTFGQPIRIAASGNHAHILLSSGTLQTFDLSVNPLFPQNVGSVSVAGNPADIVISGSYAYIPCTGDDTIRIYSLSTPATPTFVGSIATGTTDPHTAVVSGDHLFVLSADQNGLRIIDISNPTAPALSGLYWTGASDGTDVAVVGTTAFVADGANLQIVNVSNPAAPTYIATPLFGFRPNRLLVANSRVFATDLYNPRLYVLDVPTPLAPQVVGQATTMEMATCIAVSGNYAFVGTELGRFQPFELSGSASFADQPVFSAAGFAGSGANLTNLDANSITWGQIDSNRLSTGGHWYLASELNVDSNTLVVDPTTNRIGIGTDTPIDGLLHLHGGTTTNIKFTNTTTGSTASDGFFVGLAGSSNPAAWVWQRESEPMVFGTGNVERMRIDASGNVGISKGDPLARLDIVGLGASPVVLARSASDAQGRRSVVGFYSTFEGTADNGSRRTADILAGFNGGVWGTEYLAFHVGNNGAANDAGALTGEKMRIDALGNVGIGNSNPAAALHVDRNADVPVSIAVDSGLSSGQYSTIEFMDRGTGRIGIGKDPGGDFFVDNAGVARLFTIQRTTGRVGVSRAPKANMLEVEGNASKSVSGSWLANSDARIKTDVQTVAGALDTLDRVRLVSFNYTPEYLEQHPSIEDRRYLNIIAQEFAQVFPEHVRGSGEFLPNGEEILQVDIHPLTIYAAAAVQELNAKVKALAARPTVQVVASPSISREEVANMLAAKDGQINELQSEVDGLKSELATLRAMLDRLIEERKQ